jgi:hypothetical protein
VSEIACVTGRSEAGSIEIESLFTWNGKKYVPGLGNFTNLLNKRSKVH